MYQYKDKGILVKYLRDERNNKVGVVVATGSGRVGYSRLHDRDREDLGIVFNRDRGVHLAVKRSNDIEYWEKYLNAKVFLRFGTSEVPEFLIWETFPILSDIMDELRFMDEKSKRQKKWDGVSSETAIQE